MIVGVTGFLPPLYNSEFWVLEFVFFYFREIWFFVNVISFSLMNMLLGLDDKPVVFFFCFGFFDFEEFGFCLEKKEKEEFYLIDASILLGFHS